MRVRIGTLEDPSNFVVHRGDREVAYVNDANDATQLIEALKQFFGLDKYRVDL
jgi:hypothetical protein